MKANSISAFILTLVALSMMLGLLGWLGYNKLSEIISKNPEYCNQFSVNLIPETYSSILEIGQGKLIKVNMTNNGFEDEFKVGIKGPEWVAARPFKIKLGQGQSNDIFVYTSPTIGSEGNYTITVFVESYCGYTETNVKVRV